MILGYLVEIIGFLCLLISVIIQDPLQKYKEPDESFSLIKIHLRTKYFLGFGITYIFCGGLYFSLSSTLDFNIPVIIFNKVITIIIYSSIVIIPFLISILSIRFHKIFFNDCNHEEKEDVKNNEFINQLGSIKNRTKNEKNIFQIVLKIVLLIVLTLFLFLFILWISQSITSMKFTQSQQNQVIRINNKLEEIDKKFGEDNMSSKEDLNEFRKQLLEEKKYCLSNFDD